VLIFITEFAPRFSGHGIYLRHLLPRLVQLGVQIKIVSCDFGYLPWHDVIDGIEVERIPVDHGAPDWNSRQQWELLKYLHQHRDEFDLLHFSGHVDIYGLITLWCKLFGKKIVMQMVLLGADDPTEIARAYRFTESRFKILRQMDAFIGISQAILDSCVKQRFSSSKLHLIAQGVDLDHYQGINVQQKLALRQQLKLPDDAAIACFVGGVIPRKGVDWLIEAWQRVQLKLPNAQLLIVGPDDFPDEENAAQLSQFIQDLKSEVERAKLRVEFVGRSSRVVDYLQASDVFVLPSRHEGFGNVIVEAMACHLPVVVTEMGGVALETVVDGQTGYIVQDVEQLAGRLATLLSQPELAQKMGESGRVRAQRYFDLNPISERYVQLYREVLG
jgi:glycosyltransferase involved in cell wall biosynthesis